MGGKRFSTIEEVKEELEKWSKGLVGNYFKEGIKKLIPQFTTCIERNGDYLKNRLDMCIILHYNMYYFHFTLQELS